MRNITSGTKNTSPVRVPCYVRRIKHRISYVHLRNITPERKIQVPCERDLTPDTVKGLLAEQQIQTLNICVQTVVIVSEEVHDAF